MAKEIQKRSRAAIINRRVQSKDTSGVLLSAFSRLLHYIDGLGLFCF